MDNLRAETLRTSKEKSGQILSQILKHSTVAMIWRSSIFMGLQRSFDVAPMRVAALLIAITFAYLHADDGIVGLP